MGRSDMRCNGKRVEFSTARCVWVLIIPWVVMILPTILTLVLSAIAKKNLAASVGGYDNLIDNW
jgi:hypothetical protein